MQIERIVCGAFEANAYLVGKEGREDALMIDPGDDWATLCAAVQKSGRKLGAIVLTHGHFDHMLSARRLREAFDAPILIHELDAPYLGEESLNCYQAALCDQPFEPFEADLRMAEGPLTLAGMALQVLHTPGHTPGSACLQLGEEALFTGDTLFAGGYGRMDLPGGSVKDMSRSLGRLFALPMALAIHPGHGACATIGSARGVFR